ncbi:MAG: ribokinase [Glaciecola sp.]
MAIYNFGSINIDHVYLVPHFVTPGETLSASNYQSVLGGKGANQSIACAQAGADVKHVGTVHENDMTFVNTIREAGVDCQYITLQSTTPTGHAIIQVSSSGENAIVLYAGANHSLQSQTVNNILHNARPSDWVLLQNETNAIDEIINEAAKKGVPIAFNPAPMTADTAKLPLEKVALLILNEVEAMQLTQTQDIPQAIVALNTQYPNTKVILTLGKAGVCYLHAGKRIDVAGFTVEAIDTTAAGDTFTGYFLANYISLADKHAPQQALKTACAAAAIAVTRAGAAPSIPQASEVDAFLAAQ